MSFDWWFLVRILKFNSKIINHYLMHFLSSHFLVLEITLFEGNEGNFGDKKNSYFNLPLVFIICLPLEFLPVSVPQPNHIKCMHNIPMFGSWSSAIYIQNKYAVCNQVNQNWTQQKFKPTTFWWWSERAANSAIVAQTCCQ